MAAKKDYGKMAREIGLRRGPGRSVSMGPRDTRNTMGNGRGAAKMVKITAPKKASKSGKGGGG